MAFQKEILFKGISINAYLRVERADYLASEKKYFYVVDAFTSSETGEETHLIENYYSGELSFDENANDNPIALIYQNIKEKASNASEFPLEALLFFNVVDV